VSLKDVQIVDKYTGIINLKEPSAAIWWSVLPFSAGAIVCKKAVEAQGGKFTTNPGATAGPYDIASWAPGDRISLVAHENWGGPKPAYSKVTILPISDLKAAEVAFEAGQVDFAQVAVSSVPDLKKNMPKGAKLDVRPVWGYFWLGLNSVHPKLADIRVRQAIIKAVDVDGIIDGAYFSMGSRATGFVAPGLVGHRDIAMPKRDVAGATALLKEASVSSLSLDIDVSNSPDEQTSAQIIQANLADVGITVNINVHDQGTFLNLSNEKGKELQLSLQRYTSPPDPAWSTQWFLSSQAGVWNWQWFQSEEFDRLHVAAIQELDPAKRGKMYERMQQLMDDSATFLWLLHPPVALIYRDTLAPALLSNGDLDFRDFKPAG
jgi:peptide/nickel transport system substrate-binding protein